MLRVVFKSLRSLVVFAALTSTVSIVLAQPPSTPLAEPSKLSLDSEPYSLFMESSSAGVTYRNVTDEQVQQIVKALKLYSHGEFGGGVATKYPDGRPREIVFGGAFNKVVVRPGETKFASFSHPCNIFFWQAGDAPEGVGEEDAEPKPAHEKMSHVCCQWDKDGKVQWSLYGPAPFFSKDKPQDGPGANSPAQPINAAVKSRQENPLPTQESVDTPHTVCRRSRSTTTAD